MSIKILATADLHLGRMSTAVPEHAEERSSRYTWEGIVEWAVQHHVDLLLLAGDIIDEDNRFFEAIGPLQSGFRTLKNNGVQVCMIAGNHDHDVLAQVIRDEQYDHIHMLGTNGEWEVTTFSHSDGAEIQIAGWSFPGKYVRQDPLGGFDDLTLDSDRVILGLLHADVGVVGSKYAPVSLHHLAGKPVDAWILGHIHSPGKLQSAHPYIAYTGTPHALNPGEPGLHGPILLEINGKEDIRISRVPLSPVRYENVEVDVSEAEDAESFRHVVSARLLSEAQALLSQLEKVAFLICDVKLTGENRFVDQINGWKDQVLNYTTSLETNTRVLVRKIDNRVQPAVMNLQELATHDSPAGKLAETILAIQDGESTPFLDELTGQWQWNLTKINQSATYLPLMKEGRLAEPSDEKAREYILNECNRLLGALLSQQKK